MKVSQDDKKNQQKKPKQNPKQTNPFTCPIIFRQVLKTTGIQDITELKIIVFLKFLLQSKILQCSSPLTAVLLCTAKGGESIL